MRKLTRALLLVLLVTGCAPYALVEPKRIAIDNGLTVEPQIAWTRPNPDSIQKRGPTQAWTVDGFALDEVLFYPGIADGQPLARQVDGQEKLPVFKKDLTAPEIMDLLEATVRRANQTTLTETHNLRPADFGGVPGFRFEMNVVLKDELPRKAIAAGAVSDGKLYMIVYQAPRLYYFDKYADVVERIIASAQLPQPVRSASVTGK
jgi:hypothetical protein